MSNGTVLLDPFMAARLGEAARAKRGVGDMEVTVPNNANGRVTLRPNQPVQGAPANVTVKIRTDPPQMPHAVKPDHIIVVYPDGQIVLDSSMADCFFWGEEACEKFLFPYYAAQYGVAYACEMRRQYFLRERSGICHHPGSEPCDPDRIIISAGMLLLDAAAALR